MTGAARWQPGRALPRRIALRAVVGTLTFLTPLAAKAATYYVAPSGSDTAAGTQAAPFASWARAQTAVAPGDTVYFRGGTYKYTAATSSCGSPTSTVDSVVLSKSGTSGNRINYWAYPGETPVFDFSGLTDTSKYSCRQVGVNVQADWLYLKGLELTGVLQLNNQNHESWCVYVTNGNNNTFEMLNAHHNMGPGFFIVHGGNNLFLNCDSHENEDTLTSNGDGQSADGFGCHPNKQGDTGNVFRGCRAWWNSDDAWDFINAQEACTVEYSWAWYSGYKPDTLNNGQPAPLTAGNGNGFKGGGYGDPQTGVPTPTPLHTIRFDCAFYNKANGLYANHEIVNPYFYNNTSFNNGTDVNMLGLNGTTVTSVGTLRNNLAYSNDAHALTSNMTNGGPISDQFNSWPGSLNLPLANTDFQSLAFTPAVSCPPTDMTCFAGMASARQADGSLPVVPFLRLSTMSQAIGKGTNLGFPFTGMAPDLGCFDHGGLTYDGGSPSSSSGGGSSGGPGGSSSGSSGATSSSGGTSSGGASSSGTSSGGTGSSSNGGSSGGASTGGSSGAGTSTGGSSGAGGQGASSGAGATAGGASSGVTGSMGGFQDGAPQPGCGCHVEGGSAGGGASVFALGMLVAARRRRARRARKSA
jgi:MYXO-CTERM domain-containing protein